MQEAIQMISFLLQSIELKDKTIAQLQEKLKQYEPKEKENKK